MDINHNFSKEILVKTSTLPLFEAIKHKLEWLSSRQTVLSKNVANADTPNYKPVDLKEANFQSVLKKTSEGTSVGAGVGFVKTSKAHINATGESRDIFRSKKDKETFQTSLDGNKVSVEEQLSKISQTKMDHQLLTSLLKKHTELMKTAISIRV